MAKVSALKPYDISTEEHREEFIVSYVPYVSSVAKQVSRQFGCPEIDELKSAGYQGLLEAVNKFDTSKNVNFKYYAYIRIYGHMLDHMRKLYAGSNAIVAMKRKINKIIDAKQALGIEFDSQELANELGLTLPELHKAQNDINRSTFVLNFTDLSGDSEETSFNIQDTFLADKPITEDDLVLVDQLWAIMKDRFHEREVKIMDLIYKHDKTYPEISLEIGITDRRISQLHLSILARLNKLVKQGRHSKRPEGRVKHTNNEVGV